VATTRLIPNNGAKKMPKKELTGTEDETNAKQTGPTRNRCGLFG